MLDVDVNSCKQHVRPVILRIEIQSIVNCLHTLISVKCSQVDLKSFDSTEVDDMIKFITVG